MLIPKKDKIAVYAALFNDGVLVARKSTRGINHHTLTDLKNIVVLQLMKSLKSRGYIKETFNWQWFYWVLTDEGVEYIRNFLHLPADIIPATHKQTKSIPIPNAEALDEKEKSQGAGHGFKPNYRKGNEGGFGRGGKRV